MPVTAQDVRPYQSNNIQQMKKLFISLVIASAMIPTVGARTGLRAPAYQLFALDPSVNLWSCADTLYSDATRHWTMKEHPLMGVLTVDSVAYRFLGQEFATAESIAPNSEWGRWSANYTTETPAAGWALPDYDDSSWTNGEAAFATDGENGEFVMIKNEFCKTGARTRWDAPYIWVRRWVDIPEGTDPATLLLEATYDDAADIYINGVQALKATSPADHRLVKLPAEAAAAIHPGKNLIAAKAVNNTGYGVIDFALIAQPQAKSDYVRTAQQTDIDLMPTQTKYSFVCGPVALDITFTAPFLPDDIELAGRPVNYISYDVRSLDGKPHKLSLRLEASPLFAVDYPGQPTAESAEKAGDLTLLRTGTVGQRSLEKWGDDRRIDWGYFYLAADNKNTTFSTAGKRLTIVRDLGDKAQAKGYVMAGYDDVEAINYMGRAIRPYWNRKGTETIARQFELAARDYDSIMKRCSEFNRDMVEAATAAGGPEYADLCTLAWRQTFAAHKLIETPEGLLLYLSKENNSNGSIGTVDLSYPSVPLFLCYNVELAKGLMNPILDYCASDSWDKDFAAHDIGRYPRGLGQNYGGDMPVEESGNMLIMAAAIAKAEGNADFAARHWATLTKWVNYLEKYGLDPENQLCTDDFAGHVAHNANLSGKAILGIAAYGYLADMQGDKKTGKAYMKKAAEMAKQWEKMADDGDHYRLTFDRPDTWSQKYNLVWDKLFGWNLFPKKVFDKETAYYLTKMNRYGLPLDSREKYSKTDWIIWSATLAGNEADFKALVHPVWMFMDETVDRVPMTDWFWTDRPEHQIFSNRSVVGAYFIKLLDSKWNKR